MFERQAFVVAVFVFAYSPFPHRSQPNAALFVIVFSLPPITQYLSHLVHPHHASPHSSFIASLSIVTRLLTLSSPKSLAVARWIHLLKTQ